MDGFPCKHPACSSTGDPKSLLSQPSLLGREVWEKMGALRTKAKHEALWFFLLLYLPVTAELVTEPVHEHDG